MLNTRKELLLQDYAQKTANPDLALRQFERLREQSSKQDWLEHPGLSSLISILGNSVALGNFLLRSPEEVGLFFQRQLPSNLEDYKVILQQSLDKILEEKEIKRLLRLWKYRFFTTLILHDLTGKLTSPQVMQQLSWIAEVLIEGALQKAEGLLQGLHGSLERSTFTVLAMGKLGSEELNFSSDVDLVYFYTSSNGTTQKTNIENHKYFILLAKKLTEFLSEITEDGFVYRVDLDLRPGGATSPIVQSMEGMKTYYESYGETWERLAFIRCRSIAGDKAQGEKLLQHLRPFIYRRYLDYSTIESIGVLKSRIAREVIRYGERNIKLGPGGIREIEFYIQVLQLIHGGRNRVLQNVHTFQAISALQNAGLIQEEVAKTLTSALLFWRLLEHRLQLADERQSHELPEDPQELTILAKRMALPSSKEILEKTTGQSLLKEIANLRQKIVPTVKAFFFEEEAPLSPSDQSLEALLHHSSKEEEGRSILGDLGFQDTAHAWINLPYLISGPPGAVLSEQGKQRLEHMAIPLFQAILDSPNPDQALSSWLQFMESRRARSTYLLLLDHNRPALKLLVKFFGSSQFLTRYFLLHPELLDELVLKTAVRPRKSSSEMEGALKERIKSVSREEEQLEALRHFQHTETLRIAINDLGGELAPNEVEIQLSDLADVTVSSAAEFTWKRIAPNVSSFPFAIIALGKYGGRELGYGSDLDLICLYQEEQARAEGLSHEHFVKFLQRFISTLSINTPAGRCYRVDVRLRPSGEQGMLVSSVGSFLTYHQKEASVWERQALLRGRVVFGDSPISSIIRQVILNAPLTREEVKELERIRQRQIDELGTRKNAINLKFSPGGLADIEYLVQTLQLTYANKYPDLLTPNTIQTISILLDKDIISRSVNDVLLKGIWSIKSIIQALRLYSDRSEEWISLEDPQVQRILKKSNYIQHIDNYFLQNPSDFLLKIRNIYREIYRHIESIL